MTAVLNDLFHEWGHDKGFLYDAPELRAVFREAGFRAEEVAQAPGFLLPARSPLSHLDLWHRHPDSMYWELRRTVV